MNAAVLHKVGEAPRYEQFADPVAEEGEVLVEMLASAVKQLDRARAAGTHYSAMQLPAVCGTDGVGRLPDGTRVFCGGPRAPYGTMAERAAVPRAWCLPLPERVDDATAAAIFNPGLSSWMALKHRARFEPGETVLILGATGTSGMLAVQLARQFGAARVVAAGRNRQTLENLHELGADATIQLDLPDAELAEAFAREGGEEGFNVVIDYVWGRPVEVLLTAMTRRTLHTSETRSRLVQVGEMAGATAAIPAAVLRSSRLEILGSGTGNAPSPREIGEAAQGLLRSLEEGKVKVEAAPVPLAEVEQAWKRGDVNGRRLVLIP